MLRKVLRTFRRMLLGRQAADLVPARAPGAALATAMHQRRARMNAAYERLIKHLDEREIKYLVDTNDRTIWADFRGEVGTYRVAATIGDEDGLFQVFGYAPVRVPAGARPAVAETITRANCGLRVGKFEMMFEEGDLRFQAAHIVSDDQLEDEVIGRLMATTIAMLDLYVPAILSVIYGNELPKDAVSQVEAHNRRPASGSDDAPENPAE
jgi:hypothetical protein